MYRIPLRQLPLDLIYFCYLISHIGATLALDSQTFLPTRCVPQALRDALASWVKMSNDPLLQGVHRPEFAWFKSFMACEMILQLPIFVVGAVGLYKNHRGFWPLLLMYGAHAATTTLPCLATIYATKGLSQTQLLTLLSSYIPYFVVPAGMAVDMLLRLNKLISSTAVASKDKSI